jgi:cysteine desulfuration protein SufE
MASLNEILSDLAALQGWEERYEYVIDLGRGLPPFPREAMVEKNRVRGCTSTVYLTMGWKGAGDPCLELQLTSDALIVNGLLAIVHAAYNGRSHADARAMNLPEKLEQSGLLEHLSPNRRHGFASVLARIGAFVGRD